MDQGNDSLIEKARAACASKEKKRNSFTTSRQQAVVQTLPGNQGLGARKVGLRRQMP